MKWTYDSGVDILTVELAGGEVHGSTEVLSGVVADFSADGTLLGLEIMDAADRIPGIREVPRVMHGDARVPALDVALRVGSLEDRELLAVAVRAVLGLITQMVGRATGQATGAAAEVLPLDQAARLVGLSPDTLRRQAERGALAARKLGRNWYTTREDVYQYAAERSRKRRAG